jgi:N-acetylglucosaminyldiphosphoundecaprenol N-acetyl-beta-D-mannosaminyltransferase
MLSNTILNVEIASIGLTELLEELSEGVLFTPNVDHLVKLQKDKEFYDTYQQADWVICDSKILNVAARFLNKPFQEVIPGSSFLPAFYTHRKNDKDIKMFLLGAKEGVALKAKENINEKVGWNIVTDVYSPSFGFEKNEAECNAIIDVINKSGCNVLVVGVGAPKQEKWIIKYKDRLPNVKIFMALGASIDFEAGTVKRAPQFYQKFHLEWLYRIFKEPRRLWKRYFIDDMPFFYYILQNKLGVYKNPFK